jgi:hypothetical protein
VCRKQLFFALIYSRLQYCIEVYSTANKSIIDPLYIACNLALRTFQNANRYHNVKQLYIEYDILPINLLGNLCVAKYIFKSLQSESMNVSSARNLFRVLNRPFHNYPTRLASTNYLYKKTGKSFYSSYVNFGSSVWNDIPTEIRSVSSVRIFMAKYKKYLLQNW